MQPDCASTGGRGMAKLRILFVTEDDPIYVIELFDRFFQEFPQGEFEICGITIDRLFHESAWRTLRRMLTFYGFWDCLRQGLRFIGARLNGRSIKSLAVAAGVPIIPAKL